MSLSKGCAQSSQSPVRASLSSRRIGHPLHLRGKHHAHSHLVLLIEGPSCRFLALKAVGATSSLTDFALQGIGRNRKAKLVESLSASRVTLMQRPPGIETPTRYQPSHPSSYISSPFAAPPRRQTQTSPSSMNAGQGHTPGNPAASNPAGLPGGIGKFGRTALRYTPHAGESVTSDIHSPLSFTTHSQDPGTIGAT